MEKLIIYQNLIKTMLTEFAIKEAGDKILADDINHQYQLFRTSGETDSNFFFRVRMHLYINEKEKICILENTTDIEIADYLIANGVLKKDIAPVFLPIEVRKFAGYAV
jgi:hypothetical protein